MIALTGVAQVGLMTLSLVADVLGSVVDILLSCGITRHGGALMRLLISHGRTKGLCDMDSFELA